MKKIISLILALIMVLGMAVPAMAATGLADSEVFGTFENGSLKSISVKVYPVTGWDPVKGALVLSTVYFDAESDYREFGTVAYKKHKTLGEAKADSELGIVTYTGFTDVYENEATLSFDVDANSLEENKIYYIYLWVNYFGSPFGSEGGVYPDFLVAAVKREGNAVKYAPVNEGSRYEYGEFSRIKNEDGTEIYSFGYAYDCQRDNLTAGGSNSYPKKDETVRLSGFDYPYISSSDRADSYAGNWTVTKIGLWGDVKNNYDSKTANIMVGVAGGYGVGVDTLNLYELKEDGTHVCYGVIAAYSVNSEDGSEIALFVGDTLDDGRSTGYALSNGQLSGSKDIEIDSDATVEDPMDVPSVPSVPTYTVTYVADGVEIKNEIVNEGEKATKYTDASDIPEKEGYTQTAPYWDYDESAITEDTTIEAKYTINTYTVTYVADGETVGQPQTIEHGKDAVAPAVPAKVGYDKTAPYWDKDGKDIKEDTTINAVYTINTYTVNYVADGKTVGQPQTIEHGKDAVAPEIPRKVGYDRTKPVWNHDGKNITADTTITAEYTINEYLVTYIFLGKVVDEQWVEHGSDAVAPKLLPGAKWEHDGKNITDDIEIEAIFRSVSNRNEKPEDIAEANPSTGAPVFAPAVIVLSAAAAFLGKRK